MAAKSTPRLTCSASDWMSWDPNPATRAAVESLMGSDDDLVKVLGKRLQFGTAGLRGPMGTGTSCMNDLTVIQATQGLAVYLEKTLGIEEAHARGVVTGMIIGRLQNSTFRLISLRAAPPLP